MDEATYKKIKAWIFDNHEHHAGTEKFVMTLSGEEELRLVGEEMHEDTSECTDGNYPYVNSMDLEKFIDSLVSKEWVKHYIYGEKVKSLFEQEYKMGKNQDKGKKEKRKTKKVKTKTPIYTGDALFHIKQADHHSKPSVNP